MLIRSGLPSPRRNRKTDHTRHGQRAETVGQDIGLGVHPGPDGRKSLLLFKTLESMATASPSGSINQKFSAGKQFENIRQIA